MSTNKEVEVEIHNIIPHYIKTATVSSCERWMYGELVVMVDGCFNSFEYHYDIEGSCIFIVDNDTIEDKIKKDLAGLAKHVYEYRLYASS